MRITLGLLASLGIAGAIPTITAPGCASLSPSPSPTRTFELGTAIGVATPVTSVDRTTTVYNYLGIPFAAVPTGSLRFAPPASATKLLTPLQATAFPPACIQQFDYPLAAAEFSEEVFGNPGGLPLPVSEDCLYLNVFAPTDASPQNKKAVLFWIFGGDLVFGSGSLGVYNGSSFAGFQDVVVVTINYRTNIFGFSNSPEIPLGQQNSGFLDQRAALDWVQKNIANFGGNPSKVTIFGESAGGYSVKQLLANPPSPLPFRAAILESEAASAKGNGTAHYLNVTSHFGCDASASQLACLRQVNSTDLINYIAQNDILFSPVNDNVTQSNDVRPSIASKRWANVPFFLGTNADEGRVFALEAGVTPNSTIPLDLAVGGTFTNTTLVAEVLKAYAGYAASVNNDTYLVLSRIITDMSFACPVSALTNSTRANGYEETWRYYYNASFPNEASFPESGAFHSSEIPQVFGTYASQPYAGPATKDQEGLSGYMQTAWANFAKNPSSGPGWVKLGSGPEDLADLGGIDPVGAVLVSHNVADEFCDVFKTLLDQVGL